MSRSLSSEGFRFTNNVTYKSGFLIQLENAYRNAAAPFTKISNDSHLKCHSRVFVAGSQMKSCKTTFFSIIEKTWAIRKMFHAVQGATFCSNVKRCALVHVTLIQEIVPFYLLQENFENLKKGNQKQFSILSAKLLWFVVP